MAPVSGHILSPGSHKLDSGSQKPLQIQETLFRLSGVCQIVSGPKG